MGFEKGAKNHNWQGGRRITDEGYVQILQPDGSYIREHILVAERALGKTLPSGAVPHHVNENRADNRPGNLVVCQDRAYHSLIHRRMRALKACGHASWRCWDDPTKMYVNPKGAAWHRSCFNEYRRTK